MSSEGSWPGRVEGGGGEGVFSFVGVGRKLLAGWRDGQQRGAEGFDWKPTGQGAERIEIGNEANGEASLR